MHHSFCIDKLFCSYVFHRTANLLNTLKFTLNYIIFKLNHFIYKRLILSSIFSLF